MLLYATPLLRLTTSWPYIPVLRSMNKSPNESVTPLQPLTTCYWARCGTYGGQQRKAFLQGSYDGGWAGG